MCGISGIFEINSSKIINPKIIEKMNAAIFKRGPDDGGVYTAKGIGLGNRRLSIIDLAGGHQPIFNEDKNLAIVFNGEIYNFFKLREELVKKGHKFSTKTDTEVILHLFEEDGESCVKKLDGMFAFAIWDEKKRELFLARDPLGEKPLHWARIGNKFIFSSEIKGILTYPEFKKEIDRQSLAKYLLYGFIPAPQSIFTGINKLLPGHFMTINKGGKIRTKKYWEIDYSSQFEDMERGVVKKKIIGLLKQSVEERLISDVPLGVFLSGGVDSSLVVAIMTQLIKPSQIQAFSIGFRETKFDESYWAKMVAKHLGVKHHLKIFSQKELMSLIPKVVDFLDEPMGDPSILPTFLLSSFTRERVKVALSGDGGDEAFAGYPKYLAHWLLGRTKLEKIPLSYAAKFFPTKWSNFLKYASYPIEQRNQLWISPFSPEDVEKAVGVKPDFDDLMRYSSNFSGQNNYDRAIFLDQKLTLPDLYLVKTDRASMAASLEIRCPFLDRQLVEFSAKIPLRLKIRGLKTKSLLKKIASEFLPKEAIYRPKMGFGIPLARWLKGELISDVEEFLSTANIKKEGIFDPEIVENVVKYGTTQQIWVLLVFSWWHRRWMKN